MRHLQIQLRGILQGIGFRPFVYRLAQQYRQNGSVTNTQSGVVLHIEGQVNLQNSFLTKLESSLPPFAEIKSIVKQVLPLVGYQQFTIQPSDFDGQSSLFVLPDIASCPECVTELFNSDSRYFRYPFISCCHCGPRYSIMQRQPYDREQTSMNEFTLCESCQCEFETPENRRFHAQTLACSACGPTIRLLNAQGLELAAKENAIAECVRQLRAGKIIALKGTGGYQLLVNARDDAAVARLRQRKIRPVKPFALLVADLAMVTPLCDVSQLERQTLHTAMAPIVLLKKRKHLTALNQVAPDSAFFGVMLASSGLQHLIIHDFAGPLIATSGNRHGEPICINEAQAITELHGIADYYLTHNRAILRALDDSIVRVIADKPRILRRARGYVPLPFSLDVADGILALGGHLKSGWALSHDSHVLLSQHLGDMTSLATQQHFQQSLRDAQDFYQLQPLRLIHDRHPDYFTSLYAAHSSLPKTAVQHHIAHAFACMAEHQLKPPILAVIWDGTGLGLDHTSWGGEFFIIKDATIQRFAHFKPFALIGGDKANKEPRRLALALLYQLFGDNWQNQVGDLSFSLTERQLLLMVLKNNLNTPQSSSVGRLFDAVASLLKLCHINQYEGQAAMRVEAQASLVAMDDCYPYVLLSENPVIIDWQAIIAELLEDLSELSTALIAAKFHNTLVDIILQIAHKAGQSRVVLSGGCFQNGVLTEKVHQVLESEGFQVYSHEHIPANDAGLAVGQLYAAQFDLGF